MRGLPRGRRLRPTSTAKKWEKRDAADAKPVPAAEALEVLQDLIWKLGEVTDDGGDSKSSKNGTTFSWDAAPACWLAMLHSRE